MKRSCNNVSFPIIAFANKNNKMLVDVMEKINFIQLEIK